MIKWTCTRHEVQRGHPCWRLSAEGRERPSAARCRQTGGMGEQAFKSGAAAAFHSRKPGFKTKPNKAELQRLRGPKAQGVICSPCEMPESFLDYGPWV
ncbi:hypothetical protein AAFF_G00283790 [Aldrovandia affinis]|uniref:Uncharacterized protein n=1 Tax=Aldrovandia affinis TaxID=143900 RepID=A0AAD7TA22_9TELE|nr:hypothetical protein AAFF_G00283790 [Aldrovandia affinis]